MKSTAVKWLLKCFEILGDGHFLKIEDILSFTSISGNLILGKDWNKKRVTFSCLQFPATVTVMGR